MFFAEAQQAPGVLWRAEFSLVRWYFKFSVSAISFGPRRCLPGGGPLRRRADAEGAKYGIGPAACCIQGYSFCLTFSYFYCIVRVNQQLYVTASFVRYVCL